MSILGKTVAGMAGASVLGLVLLALLAIMDPVVPHADATGAGRHVSPPMRGTIACDVAGSFRCVLVTRGDAGKIAGLQPVDVSGLSREDRSRLMPCSLEEGLICHVSASFTGNRTDDGLDVVGSLEWVDEDEVLFGRPPRPAERTSWKLDPTPAGAMGVKDALLDWKSLTGEAIDVGGSAICGRHSCLVAQWEKDGRGYSITAYSLKAELADVGAHDLRRMEACNEGGGSCAVKVHGFPSNPGRIEKATIEWLSPPDPGPSPETRPMVPVTSINSALGMVSGSFRTLAILRSMQHQPILPGINSPSGSPWFVILSNPFQHVAVLPHVSQVGCRILSSVWFPGPMMDWDIYVRSMEGERFWTSWSSAPRCMPSGDTDMLVNLPDDYILAPDPYVHPRHQW